MVERREKRAGREVRLLAMDLIERAIMIYHDSYAQGDKDFTPATRFRAGGEELCINCNHGWGSHRGWRCTTVTTTNFTNFHHLHSHERYLTPSMAASILHPPGATIKPPSPFCGNCGFAKLAHPTQTATGDLLCPISGKLSYWKEPGTTAILIQQPKQKVVDVSDWRAWAHNRPGECACGIPKERCEYHR